MSAHCCIKLDLFIKVEWSLLPSGKSHKVVTSLQTFRCSLTVGTSRVKKSMNKHHHQHHHYFPWIVTYHITATQNMRPAIFWVLRLRLKCDGTHAETSFRLSAKRTSPFKWAGCVSPVDYWQASCAHQPAGFVLLVKACVLQSYDAYWLLTPFASFPFISPLLRHRVPSHFKRSIRRE